MTRRIAVLVNPTSGRGRGARAGAAAVARLRERGCNVQEMAGRDAAHAATLAHQAVSDGHDCVVAVGGDGMANLVLQAVAGRGTQLGLVPAGSGNDFARALDLRPHDPAHAADVIAEGYTRTVDAGRVGDRWFAGVLSSGFDSQVNERANAMTWPRGRMRYNVAIMAELRVFRALRFTVEMDGHRIEREAMLVAVGNGPSYGGGMRVCPQAVLDDGLLNVTVLGRVGKPEFLRIFPRVYSGRHVDHPSVSVFTARQVRLEAPGALAYADGERVGALPVIVDCVPGAVQVLVPPGPAVA